MDVDRKLCDNCGMEFSTNSEWIQINSAYNYSKDRQISGIDFTVFLEGEHTILQYKKISIDGDFCSFNCLIELLTKKYKAVKNV